MTKTNSTFDLQSLLSGAFEQGCTQSEMTTLDNCGQLWFYRYGMLLRKKTAFSWATTYGSAFHTALEQMYATQGKRWSCPDINDYVPKGMSLSLDQQKQREYWQGVLNVQTECYEKYYRDDFEYFKVDQAEVIVDLNFEWQGQTFRMKGMIDLIFATLQGHRFIMDHKTTSRLDIKTVQGWDFRFQFMFYLWLYYRLDKEASLKGYFINAIKKPTIKVRQNDTLDQFLDRLRNEMLMEPEKYYYREKLLLSKTSMDHFEQNVLGPKLNRIALLTNPKIDDSIKSSIVNNMNTDYCQRYGGACEFLPLCQHGFDIEGFQYETRGVKHVELEGEED